MVNSWWRLGSRSLPRGMFFPLGGVTGYPSFAWAEWAKGLSFTRRQDTWVVDAWVRDPALDPALGVELSERDDLDEALVQLAQQRVPGVFDEARVLGYTILAVNEGRETRGLAPFVLETPVERYFSPRQREQMLGLVSLEEVEALARATAEALSEHGLSGGNDVFCVAAICEPGLVPDEARYATGCQELMVLAEKHGLEVGAVSAGDDGLEFSVADPGRGLFAWVAMAWQSGYGRVRVWFEGRVWGFESYAGMTFLRVLGLVAGFDAGVVRDRQLVLSSGGEEWNLARDVVPGLPVRYMYPEWTLGTVEPPRQKRTCALRRFFR